MRKTLKKAVQNESEQELIDWLDFQSATIIMEKYDSIEKYL